MQQEQSEQQQQQRPYDLLGPPSDPLPFDAPQYDYGQLADQVLCLNPLANNQFRKVNQVLFPIDNPNVAYAIVPSRRPQDTPLGHVQVYQVLQRRVLSTTTTSTSIQETNDKDTRAATTKDTPYFYEMLPQQWVAIKVCYLARLQEFKRQGQREDPLDEIAALQLLGRHNNNNSGPSSHVTTACQVLYVPQDESIRIVLPFYGGGDLFGHVVRHGRLSEAEAKRVMKHVMLGLRATHDARICHHDLSPENIMLDERGNATIIDFGLSLRIPYTTSATHNNNQDDPELSQQQRRCLMHDQGTFGKNPYMAPDVYVNPRPFGGEAIDVWSAGVTLFFMLTGRGSYDTPQGADRIFSLMTRDVGRLLTICAGTAVSPACIDLLQRMLQKEPRLRATIDEVLSHSWFHHL